MPSGGRRLDWAPVISFPPYALTPPTFRFRALVALAERLPLGGEREVVLATFLAARLLWDWDATNGTVPATVQQRASAARQWLQALALPTPSRVIFQQLTDAVGRGDLSAALTLWDRALGLSGRALDGASRADFKTLAGRLGARDSV